MPLPGLIGTELLSVPFPLMVASMGLAIAEAQGELDRQSIKSLKKLQSTAISLPKLEGTGEESFSALSLGFFPTFYQFQATTIEVKITLNYGISSETDLSANTELDLRVFASSFNASYSQKYDYKAEGSSLLQTKLAPVPPPAILQAYMNKLIAKEA
ncbi:MAG: hypothetical protein U0572_02445 [Phycisphaerales bacterium]